ncbi:MAG: glutathione S-transferase family protein [Rhizobiales bacterium]|nr:glutathione S-transferase family protein [Hyphomicrobiales bacterium]
MNINLLLVSHHLCPYVQRAVISLLEKQVEFERVSIDLSAKPDWFLEISPLGKTPVLQTGRATIFESSVILEFLEDTQDHPLHPSDPYKRAENRSWIEFSSALLNDIAGLYNAPSEGTFDAKRDRIAGKIKQLEDKLVRQPYFNGNAFSLVDAAFGPVFRYFDVFDKIDDLGLFAGCPKARAWRAVLHNRPSIQQAVTEDYESRLLGFLLARQAHISTLIKTAA